MRNLYLTVALVFGLFFQVNAALITWTGGGAPNDFSDPLNWDSGTVPTAADDVVITGGSTTVNLGAPFTAASLEIAAGATLIIDATGILNLGGDDGVDTDGALDLSSPTGTIINNGLINIINAAEDGIDSRGASFINNGDIFIAGFGNDGISVEDSSAGGSTFTNNGLITIDIVGGGGDGILIDDESMLISAGTINISSSDCSGGVGIVVNGAGVLTNTATGTVDIFNTLAQGILIGFGSFIENFGFIGTSTIGQCAGSGRHGVEVRGTFNNNAGATYKDVGARGDEIRITFSGTFNNVGNLILDPASNTSDSIENQGIFNSTGSIEIGCNTINEIEFREDSNLGNLGSSCIIFDIPSNGRDGVDHDRIEIRNDLDLSAATAKINWGTFIPAPGECFRIVFGTAQVTGLFGSISSIFPVTQSIGIVGNEINICIDAVLPVELVGFEAVKVDRGAKLLWATASELQNSGFDIERSADTKTWSTIGFVHGNGDSNTANRYDFMDANPVDGTNYYRLKQLDYDGAATYTKVVSLVFERTGKPTTISAYPNPVNDVLFIDMDPTAEISEVQLFDYAGKLLYSSSTAVNQIPFDQYESGIYILKVRNGANTITKKITK